MPLEIFDSTSTIADLNEAWPNGQTDDVDGGDNHIRGNKLVLKNVFGTLDDQIDAVPTTVLPSPADEYKVWGANPETLKNGKVKLTSEQINRGSVPVGSKLVFWNKVAPPGWTRVAGVQDTKMLRVVGYSTQGGNSGGLDNPILMDKVPAHAHVLSGTTGTQSASHGHSVQMDRTTGVVGVSTQSNNVAVPYSPGGMYWEGANGLWTRTSGNENATHTHALSGTCDENVGASTWQPRYLDVILCERTS